MKKVVFLLMGLGLLSGCAVTTEQIILHYEPQKNVAKIEKADSVSVDVVVKDDRPDMSRVSRKKNGFGMEMASITATEDVTVTIRKAIEQELVQRGFNVEKSANVSITAELTRFYNDFKLGFFAGDAVADLNMSVDVYDKNNSSIYTRKVVVQGIEKNIQLMTGDNARLALNDAIKNGMELLFEDKTFISALLATAR